MITKNGILRGWYDDTNEIIIDLKEVAMVSIQRDESSRYWDDSTRQWRWRFDIKFLFKNNNSVYSINFKNGAQTFFKEISDYLMKEHIAPEQMDALLDKDINTVSGFSTRTLNVFSYAGIKTVRDLVNTKPRSLLKYRNFGNGSLHEVYNFLEEHGLRK